jgi:type VI protein secretion system component VasK
VDKEFENLHRLVKGEGGKAPLDATLELLDGVSRYMKSVEDLIARAEQIPPGSDEVIARVRAEAPRQPLAMLREMLQEIAGDSAARCRRAAAMT